MGKAALILAMLLIVSGCDEGTGLKATGTTPLMDPFQGTWHVDQQKTLAWWENHGVPTTQIAQAQQLTAAMPLHPDLKVQGTTVVLPGVVEGEYAVFALHRHGSVSCGKAWHHEDRHDPGDMSKCYVRFDLSGKELHFSIRADENSADPSDPDIMNLPATAPAGSCAADSAKDPPWSPWQTYIFTR